jgi:hypothetical protein
MNSSESTSDLVQRVLAHDLRVDRARLNECYRWIDDVTREDASFLLANLQGELVREVFPSYINDEELERISTVGGLVAFIETELTKGKDLNKETP